MWSTEYTRETPVVPKAAWAALRDLHTGTNLSERSNAIELHGPYCLEIDGPAADDVGPELGPQISEDFPADMDDLVAAASRPGRIAHTNN